MEVYFVKKSKERLPRSYLLNFLNRVERECRRKKVLPFKKPSLGIIFLTPKEIQKLNQKYRNKNKVTDVLSFSGEGSFLGEVVLCLEEVKKRAKIQKIHPQKLLSYMLLHGLLHLLGFEHEDKPSEARRMFQIQDEIFDKLTIC